MKNQSGIPDAQARAKNIAHWKEVCTMLDALNQTLEEASTIAEAELQKNPLYTHRRELLKKQG
jgi:hypothetical protein